MPVCPRRYLRPLREVAERRIRRKRVLGETLEPFHQHLLNSHHSILLCISQLIRRHSAG
jgi:hypothetical protein